MAPAIFKTQNVPLGAEENHENLQLEQPRVPVKILTHYLPNN